jgi:hypothetical protein
MMATEEKSVIELANERMTIVDACNELGMDIYDFSISSLKVYCPFGHLYHSDGGTSKAMRIYPATNSAWCFAGCGYFTPVKLLSLDKGISEEEAAESILETTKYIPPDYESRWEALVTAETPMDTDALSDALKVACARLDPNWEAHQFEDAIATKLRKCLQLLSKVHTEEDATKWLTITKQIMRKALGETTS